MSDFSLTGEHDINDLLAVMRILRSEDGCPWDKVQTHESIRQNCLEEAYEVCGAIDDKDVDELKEELGDLLLQVVFHTIIEEEQGHFEFNDVTNAITTKLIHRHPHVFKDRDLYSGAEKDKIWEQAKREEHGQKSTADAVEGRLESFYPEYGRSQKMLKKAKTSGYNINTDLNSLVQKFQSSSDGNDIDEMKKSFQDLVFVLVYMISDRFDAELAVQEKNDLFTEEFRTWEENNQ